MNNKLIFIVDDEPALTNLVSYWITKKWGYDVKIFTSGEEYLKEFQQEPDCVLLDIMLPGISGVELLKVIKSANENLPVIMLSAQGSIDTAVETLKSGAYDYFPKPVDLNKLQITLKNAIHNYDLIRELDELRNEQKRDFSFQNIVAVDSKMQEIFKLMSKVLNNPVNVLITGESGTGKELIAKAIHYNGDRKDKPFIVVNCASIPHDLLESEFFGHEKGSFTGAYTKKTGKFEIAEGGTIFLDEIGELELSLQAKLLRVLQERTFERVGGTETLKTTARVIAASNKNLKKAIEENTFREDLYYRLSTFPITIPPLRDRKSDITLIADHIVKTYSASLNRPVPALSKQVMATLLDYPWPGNVRELENVLQRGIILCDDNQIQMKDLPLSLQSFETNDPIYNKSDVTGSEVIVSLDVLEQQAIEKAIKLSNGNLQKAAKQLKISTATIYRLVKKYQLKTKN